VTANQFLQELVMLCNKWDISLKPGKNECGQPAIEVWGRTFDSIHPSGIMETKRRRVDLGPLGTFNSL